MGRANRPSFNHFMGNAFAYAVHAVKGHMALRIKVLNHLNEIPQVMNSISRSFALFIWFFPSMKYIKGKKGVYSEDDSIRIDLGCIAIQ